MKWRTIILAAVIGVGSLAAGYRFQHACNFRTYFHALADNGKMSPVERALFSFLLASGHQRT